MIENINSRSVLDNEEGVSYQKIVVEEAKKVRNTNVSINKM
jgi:hypothetical protein